MTQNDFYLAGGTAIALLLGHRKSVDLDWFTKHNMGDPLQWVKRIKNQKINLQKVRVDQGTLYTRAQGVPLSLFEYRYPLLRPAILWKAVGCQLASLDDLSCMKLSAIAQRGSKKDFIDLYALLKKHKSLKQMLALYQKKFDGADLSPVMYGLSYHDDAEKERMPRMLWKIEWKTVKQEILTTLKKSLQ